jgi:hypothetical protein
VEEKRELKYVLCEGEKLQKGGKAVEKILVKTGIYSFIVSFFLFIAFIKREKTTTDVEEMSSFEVTPFPEYFFKLFRYSVILSIIAVVAAFLYVYYLKDEISEKESGD